MLSKQLKNIEYPKIFPLPEGLRRPLWSIMIPSYNCANYLAQTLESVLKQDLSPEHMQIEVVDDCSTKDDPETVVKEVGKGRVSFYRHPQNVGAIRNFNTCIQRSQGEIIHILHGDDFVGAGFYQRFSQLIHDRPDVALFACRALFMDEQGEIDTISDRLKSLENPSNDASAFFYENCFFTPAVVIRRKFYEQFGGFCESLKHTADWEMWVRAVQMSSGISINEPLAYYRVFGGNDTSKLAKTGDNLRDRLLAGEIFASKYEGFDRSKFTGHVKGDAFNQATKFLRNNDTLSAKNNALLWWKLLSNSEKTKQFMSAIFHRDQNKLKLIMNIV
jgi:glycosyltransferase involved in cell wall biosynthesis